MFFSTAAFTGNNLITVHRMSVIDVAGVALQHAMAQFQLCPHVTPPSSPSALL